MQQNDNYFWSAFLSDTLYIMYNVFGYKVINDVKINYWLTIGNQVLTGNKEKWLDLNFMDKVGDIDEHGMLVSLN